MTSRQPTISIIVPVYNAATYLEQALDSLLCQTYTHIEVICVNDGSTDSSGDMLDQFAQKNSTIHVIHQSHAGQASARKRALAQAKGDYIMFCDADDFLERDMCQQMMDAAQTQQADLIMCDFIIEKATDDKYVDVSNINENYLHIRLLGNNTLTAENKLAVTPMLWGKLFNKSLIDQYHITFPDGNNNDHAVFVWQYLSVSQRYYGIQQPLYHYRIHADSLTTKFFSNINHPSTFDWLNGLICFLKFLDKQQLLTEQTDFFELVFNQYFIWYYQLLSPLTKIRLLKAAHDDILPLLPAGMIERNEFLQIIQHQAYDRLVDLTWQDRKKRVQQTNIPTSAPAISQHSALQEMMTKFLSVYRAEKEQNETRYINLIQSYQQLTQQLETLQEHNNKLTRYHNLGEAQLLKSIFTDARQDDERIIPLLANLDETSSDTVIKIIQRLIRINSSDNVTINHGLDFYSGEEQVALTALFTTFAPDVLHLNDDCHLYHDYILPIDFFSPHLFYDNHAIGQLTYAAQIQDKTIIDIHGGIGESAVLFQQLKPKQIISFEQDAKNISLIEQTLTLNHIENTKVCTDSLINTTTVDTYIKTNKIAHVGLIKINSESHTQPFLEGALTTIKRDKPTLMINLSQDWTTFLTIKPWLASLNLGYQFTIHKPITTCIMLDVVLIAEVASS